MSKPPSRNTIGAFLTSAFMVEQHERMRARIPAAMRPLTRPDFVAALLYDAWEDGSSRYLETYTNPVCVIDASACVYRIPVATHTVESLMRNGWIEKTPMMGAQRADGHRLRLSNKGRRQVVEFLFKHNRPRQQPAKKMETAA